MPPHSTDPVIIFLLLSRGVRVKPSPAPGSAAADLVKTTLGPKGMDKILQSQQLGAITITNDGATILVYDHGVVRVLI